MQRRIGRGDVLGILHRSRKTQEEEEEDDSFPSPSLGLGKGSQLVACVTKKSVGIVAGTHKAICQKGIH